MINIFSIIDELSLCGNVECGPNADCEEEYGVPVCRCKHSYVPLPPPQKGCTKPQNPIYCNPGPCGQNSKCDVLHGVEHCFCLPGFTGDPLRGCTAVPVVADPCVPNPCGRYSDCQVQYGQAKCVCLQGYEGDPYKPEGCEPECESPRDCHDHQTCIGLKCVDACRGACGINAECTAKNHNPVCKCKPNFHGNPKVQCIPKRVPPRPQPTPECIVNSNCHDNEVCRNNKCVDPCIGLCGINAVCDVNYHRATCSCREGYQGDPYQRCKSK